MDILKRIRLFSSIVAVLLAVSGLVVKNDILWFAGVSLSLLASFLWTFMRKKENDKNEK